MRLRAKTRYAVLALIDMSEQENGAVVSLPAIAKRQNLSLGYLEQLFKNLRQYGVVNSVRGYGSGYQLARSPQETFLLDVFHAVGEDIVLPHGFSAPSDSSSWQTCCAFWIELQIQTQQVLAHTSLADLAELGVEFPPEIRTLT